ncbi:MAG: DUF6204 family protein [Actinoplanes sp.]
MTSRDIRVTVRGSFDQLSDAHLAELVAERAEHDFLQTSYTPQGFLAYDLPARPFFTFRFAARAADETEIPRVVAEAERRAQAWFDERGYAVKGLSTQAVDMSEVPLGKRGRREAAR